MIARVRDGNQGYVVGQSAMGASQMNPSLSQFPNPFPVSLSKIDEVDDELSFIPFEHTQFSKDNIQAMALLIILFER